MTVLGAVGHSNAKTLRRSYKAGRTSLQCRVRIETTMPVRDLRIEQLTQWVAHIGGFRCPSCQGTDWAYLGDQTLALHPPEGGHAQQSVATVSCTHCAAITLYDWTHIGLLLPAA